VQSSSLNLLNVVFRYPRSPAGLGLSSCASGFDATGGGSSSATPPPLCRKSRRTITADAKPVLKKRSMIFGPEYVRRRRCHPTPKNTFRYSGQSVRFCAYTAHIVWTCTNALAKRSRRLPYGGIVDTQLVQIGLVFRGVVPDFAQLGAEALHFFLIEIDGRGGSFGNQ